MKDDEIRKLLGKVAPGKWSHPERRTGRMDEVRNESGTVIASCMFAADAELMAAAPELAREVLRLRAQLAAYEADEPDGWISYHSEMGMEWHDSRAAAEAEAVDAMTGILHDEGEAHDDQAIVLRVVAHTREIVHATSDDDSEDGEWCRARGVDYMVSGYEIRPGSGIVEVPDEG